MASFGVTQLSGSSAGSDTAAGLRRAILAAIAMVLASVVLLGTQTPALATTSAWPVGTMTVLRNVRPPCLTGFVCEAFSVGQCAGVSQPASGILAEAKPTGPPRGMVLFFSGSKGTDWWSSGSALTSTFLQGLQSVGFWVLQVRWVDPWLLSAPGEDAGSAHMACRPATIVQWVHTNVYLPLGIESSPEQCGFCITGNSGGSGQVAYALSFYGLDPILDAVVPTSGPTHTQLAKGCQRIPGDDHYWYSDSESISIDSSFGFNQQAGACLDHDSSYVTQWNAESLDAGGNRFVYPTTRVAILVGAQDCGDSPAHGAAFYDALSAAGTPFVSFNAIAGMTHSIQASANGLDELQDALLDLPIGHLGTPCYPL